MTNFRSNEKYLSQIPALQQLINLGYTYIPPEVALERYRLGRLSNVLLEPILLEQLRRLNKINFKGGEFLFSEENIQSAAQKLKSLRFDGLNQTAEAAYDLLTLGTTLEQNIDGSTKSFPLHYIDWTNWQNNVFHVSAEFSVERSGSYETARPDIVVFINGIPFATIECKSPTQDVEQAVSQTIRNQNTDYIPHLFSTVQLTLAVNKNKAFYATAGTPAKFWAVWKELEDKAEAVERSIRQPVPSTSKAVLYSGEFASARKYFDELELAANRQLTHQDHVIYSLLRPERLLELAYYFVVFDGGIKKIARYQQYFVVRSALRQIKQQDEGGRRKGGIVWHTQGSGKSLTMVMFARCLALEGVVVNPRIVVVTDRLDLDKQLGNTFTACGLENKRAKTGRELLDLISKNSASIVTTLMHKFDKALNVRDFRDESHDIFILVDESHRTNFGSLAAQMRKMLPNACYIGFTGTPILKKEKNNIAKFGGLIQPIYPMQQAVKDGAVVPLLYEGRHVEMEQNKKAIDVWFERHTQGLSDEQKADLKRKYARAEALNKADAVVYMRAFDISQHFRANWQGTGFKAQLVAPDKKTAILYHDFLNDIGHITSEVIISPPDTREGNEEVDESSRDEVQRFWKKMMTRYGTEKDYTDSIISQFKNSDDPEILIVVDKLLTGFDAPTNTVLYLCRTLRDHTLLQAIARVNRLAENKEFGYIVDYAAILGELDRALTAYTEAGLSDYDEVDIAGALSSINDQVSRLPQLHSDLWDVFNGVGNKQDEEAYEEWLADEARRDNFYDALLAYEKCLSIALSSEKFITEISDLKLREYKDDLQSFENLRRAARLRYAEGVDFKKDFEPKIKKLLDTHIHASEVTQLNNPVNIFDENTFKELKADQGVLSGKSTAAKADSIAYATKQAIQERFDEDPAFYEKFSKLVQQAIDDFKNRRITDLEYLERATKFSYDVTHKVRDDVPEKIKDNQDALAFYGRLKPFLGEDEALVVDASLMLLHIFDEHKKVGFWHDQNAQNGVINDIEDYLFDTVKADRGIPLTNDEIDDIIDESMKLAKNRLHYGR